MTFIGFISFGALAVSSPLNMAPSGKWTVDYAEAHCTLSRPFTGSTRTITLAIRIVPNSLRTAISLMEMGKDRSVRGPILIRPGNGRDITGYAVSGVKDGMRTIETYVDSPEIAGLAVSDQMFFDMGTESLQLAPTGLSKTLTVAKPCIDELLVKWKIDPAENAKVAKQPQPLVSPQTWLTDDDYPTDALRQGHQGHVLFKLVVDASGKVSDCQTLASSGYPSLDQRTCALAQGRARFSPAQTASGEPIAFTYVNRFTWRIPR